jgi:pimeloyl-ACP methyl ester carboxylesterase
LLDALVTESIGEPSFAGLLQLLHAASEGRLTGLDDFVSAVRQADAAPAMLLSQGLHDSTLCLDLAGGWDPAASREQRVRILHELAAALSDAALYPFDRATAIGNGLAQTCAQWPATRPPRLRQPDPSADLPAVPVLLLAGARDLSTPLEWARIEASKAPDGRLVVLAKAGHSLQIRAAGPEVRQVVARFLAP